MPQFELRGGPRVEWSDDLKRVAIARGEMDASADEHEMLATLIVGLLQEVSTLRASHERATRTLAAALEYRGAGAQVVVRDARGLVEALVKYPSAPPNPAARSEFLAALRAAEQAPERAVLDAVTVTVEHVQAEAPQAMSLRSTTVRPHIPALPRSSGDTRGAP